MVSSGHSRTRHGDPLVTRPIAAAVLLGCLAGQAGAAGERLDILARERVASSGCQEAGAEVSLQLELLDGARWVLTLAGHEYGGTYEVTDRQSHRLRLVPDRDSADALGPFLGLYMSALCSAPAPPDHVAFRSFIVIRDAAGKTARVALTARFDVGASDGAGRFSLTGEGSFGPLPGAVDLTKDADSDGLPDELEDGLAAAAAIVAGGNPDQLDAGEIEPFAAVIGDLADRLPLSSRAREMQRDILERITELGDASPAKGRRILRQIAKEEEALRDDPDLELAMESLHRMLGPATADGGVPAALTIPRRPLPTGKPDYEKLQRGDVMLLRSKGSFLYPWTVYYSHAGTYDGNNMVYESLGSGVQLGPLQHWKERGTRVGLGRSIQSPAQQVVAALDQAQGRYGTNRKTPYNFVFPNKLRDDAIYCSQLDWKIHQSLGVDLDSNDWRWFTQVGLKNFYVGAPAIAVLIKTVLVPAVAPDEIYYSPNVTFYSEGDN